jgi:hypothetical protein
VTSGVDTPGTVGGGTSGVVTVGVVTGRDVTVGTGIDLDTATVLDTLGTLTAEPGDTVLVLRNGRKVARLDVLAGVSVDVSVKLPRLGSGAPALPAAPGERTAVERLGTDAPASASKKG